MITAKDVLEYQQHVDDLIATGRLSGNMFKALCREVKVKFNLTDRQTLDVLNKKQDAVLHILAEEEE